MMRDHIQQRNLDYFLEWQEKYRRGYVARDAWPVGMRAVLSHHYWKKLEAARDWLAKNWSRRPVAAKVSPIWSAQSALKRR